MDNEQDVPPQTAPPDALELENLVREKAYQLWEAAGRPMNASMEYWLQAREIIEAGQRKRETC